MNGLLRSKKQITHKDLQKILDAKEVCLYILKATWRNKKVSSNSFYIHPPISPFLKNVKIKSTPASHLAPQTHTHTQRLPYVWHVYNNFSVIYFRFRVLIAGFYIQHTPFADYTTTRWKTIIVSGVKRIIRFISGTNRIHLSSQNRIRFRCYKLLRMVEWRVHQLGWCFVLLGLKEIGFLCEGERIVGFWL